ncbi:DNA mismatch repair protein MutS [Eubacterium sp.]|uniref:DNA mismatch repair protein MutS n=1 Tax=Eubacterium sp. TaxID=142586 RepID=UPI0025F2B7EA|nr:DNA mismatch repair protein MutS [Eubacterium sp.]
MELLEQVTSANVDIDSVTPMMQKYIETKRAHSDCIIFYRLGDFYEMFFEDALIASKELEITLTGKSCGLEKRVPMCGVPHHSVDSYLNRLVAYGHKVAIVEQMEDAADTKTLVQREVTRIVTPGTNLNITSLDDSKNNYLMCILCTDGAYGISVVDVGTGDYYVTEVNDKRLLIDEIYKFTPSEIVSNEVFLMSGINIDDLKNRLGAYVYTLEDWYFDDDKAISVLKDHFKVMDISGLGLSDYPLGSIAGGALLNYLLETQKNSLDHLTKITPYRTGKFMILDTSTRRNLELTETLREKQKVGSLLWVLDKTKTAMGARMLRSFIEQPLILKGEINDRFDVIESLNNELITRDEIREYLNPVYDLERLITRIAYRTANPRDLIAFKSSIEMLSPIKTILSDFDTREIKHICEELDTLRDIYELIEESIVEEPPISARDGGVIKDSFSEEIEKLRKAKTDGKGWLSELEMREREKTGIKNMKVKYNKVFGYYFEVTKSNIDMVPDYYIRKQTLTNAERFTTDELKQLEDTILGAEDKLYALEYNIFSEIREKIASQIVRVQKTAKAIAKIDAYASLAYVAERNNFVRPNINTEGVIDIKDGRHPVVEKMMPNNSFVNNDTYLDRDLHRISIITGPNMAGKSTYMRQVALITLMAQIGSFVPAKSANISICDKIFTRVGASDDLSSGQSTFMVEMTEVSNILRNATKDSLIILDEIGRGTSTFDGLSIAWSVVEYINDVNIIGAKTLFATHYHELTELEGKLDSVNNYCISVKEQGDDIVFLRKIIKGGADKSYGIQVAKLAGVPEGVIKRAKEILVQLTNADIVNTAKKIEAIDSFEKIENDIKQEKVSSDTNLEEVKEKLLSLDINSITPFEAIGLLYDLQDKLKDK